MRFVLAAVVATLVAGLAAHAGTAAPGPQCGGALWKVMTVSDSAKESIAWAPAATTIPAIAKLAAPSKITATRSAGFAKKVWKLGDVVIERYRVASNGEVVLELFDVASSQYMNAYLPASSCLTKTARGRAAILAARNAFVQSCPAPTGEWQILGAHASLSGVGFWNPVKTTQGALSNGAELRPVVGLKITQGCGKF